MWALETQWFKSCGLRRTGVCCVLSMFRCAGAQLEVPLLCVIYSLVYPSLSLLLAQSAFALNSSLGLPDHHYCMDSWIPGWATLQVGEHSFSSVMGSCVAVLQFSGKSPSVSVLTIPVRAAGRRIWNLCCHSTMKQILLVFHILLPAPEGWVRITQVVLSMSWLLPSLVITEVKSHSCIVVFNSGIM